jgi:methionyl-tRNA synthetase
MKQHMAALQFHRALESLWGAIDHANRYIVQTAPFTIYKEEAQRPRVGEILHHLLEAIRTSAHLLAPFLPDTSRQLHTLLGISADEVNSRKPWGSFFAAGHKVSPPSVLFPRIEPEGEK